ncbi:MAG: lipid carrier--UDP-N-acetylgalactosaminyltransferase, partial [Flavobacteriales bacterium]|nr:lipid carrier--UDP-N-acetylgalactosaminyltransferase [Flavobacteriales bacterium]
MLRRTIALIILFILMPILILIGLAIILSDGFPVFFKQKRIG